MAYTRIGVDIPEASRSQLESSVCAKLNLWNQSGSAALKDLDAFVLRSASGETNPDNKRSLTLLSGGAWLVANLTNGRTIQDEPKIASTLGYMADALFESYWRVHQEEI